MRSIRRLWLIVGLCFWLGTSACLQEGANPNPTTGIIPSAVFDPSSGASDPSTEEAGLDDREGEGTTPIGQLTPPEQPLPTADLIPTGDCELSEVTPEQAAALSKGMVLMPSGGLSAMHGAAALLWRSGNDLAPDGESRGEASGERETAVREDRRGLKEGLDWHSLVPGEPANLPSAGALEAGAIGTSPYAKKLRDGWKGPEGMPANCYKTPVQTIEVITDQGDP